MQRNRIKQSVISVATVLISTTLSSAALAGGATGYQMVLPSPGFKEKNLSVSQTQQNVRQERKAAIRRFAKALKVSEQQAEAIFSQIKVEKKEPLAASPSTSLGAPSGYAAGWGTAFVGVGGLTRAPVSDKVAGSSLIGIGFGDAAKWLSLEVDTAITSVNVADGGFGKDGNISLKVSHIFKNNMGVAIGSNNVTGWGNTKTQSTSSYLAATKSFALKPQASHAWPLTISAGVGNGTYSGRTGDPENKYGIFAAAALVVTPQMSVIVDATGKVLTLGGSLVPFKQLPLVLTAGWYDVTKHLDTKAPSFMASAAVVFSF